MNKPPRNFTAATRAILGKKVGKTTNPPKRPTAEQAKRKIRLKRQKTR